MTEPFWKYKSLAEMTDDEWESLCDGCGRCCLHKLEDIDSGAIQYTSVVCRYMGDDGGCMEYERRSELVPDCVVLSADRMEVFAWLPSTCAYRLIAEDKPLAWWHPLVSGDKQTVHEAGIAVAGRVISEIHVHEDDVEAH
ncbi:MAG: YcgN family cysteine cluster protein, partial [Pseudohongiellaceae bacterium]